MPREALCCALWSHQGCNLLKQEPHIEWSLFGALRTRFELRHLQDGINGGLERFYCASEHADQLPVVRGHLAHVEEIVHGEDAGQRGAQLVAYVCDEPALRIRQLLG